MTPIVLEYYHELTMTRENLSACIACIIKSKGS